MNRTIAFLFPRWLSLCLPALLAAAALTGCSDACEEAAAKTEECLGGDGESYQGSQPECSGEIECSSECTVEANCKDIYAYFRHLNTRPGAEPDNPPYDPRQNPYHRCISSCQGQ